MTKLEEKLIAGSKKPGHAKKTNKAQANKNTADARAKETANAAAKQKPLKQKQTSPGTNQPVLHPQRIWPD